MNITRKLGLSMVAAALVTFYGCGKEEPKKVEAPKAVDDTVTVKIGHAGPLTGGIAHLGKDDENGVHLVSTKPPRRRSRSAARPSSSR